MATIGIVESEFRYVEGLAGPRTLIALPRVLEFLARHPVLAGIVEEMRDEATKREATLTEQDTQCVSAMRSLWIAVGPTIRRLVVDTAKNPDVRDDSRSTLEGIDRLFEQVPRVAFPRDALPPANGSLTGKIVAAIEPYSEWIREAADSRLPSEAAAVQAFFYEVSQTKLRNDHQHRRFWLDAHVLAGAAIERLKHVAARFNPLLTDEIWRDERRREELAAYLRSKEEIEELYGDGSSKGRRDLAETIEAVKSDLRLVCKDLTHRLAIGRSHFALVRRFAARTERFDAERFRALAEQDSRAAEAHLTQEFARFLFDQGMNPLVDTRIAGLRPDILEPHLEAPIYVEAKQYGDANPRVIVTHAVRQVWDTWGRLANTYHLPEAFLVVFRIGGPRVLLPESVVDHGRRLYLVLVDIGPATESGSRQKSAAITMTEEELRPEVSGTG